MTEQSGLYAVNEENGAGENETPPEGLTPDQAIAKLIEKREAGEALTEEEKALVEQHEAPPRSLEDILGKLKPDPDHVPQYNIRKFKGKDTQRLVKLVRKVRSAESIQQAAVYGGMNAAAFEMFGVLLDEMEDEIIPFITDLAGMTVEAADEEHGGVYFDILTDLLNDERFLGALKSALRLVEAGKKLFGR